MTATTAIHSTGGLKAPAKGLETSSAPAEPGHRVIRRNGGVTRFDPAKIAIALTKAFLAVEGSTAAGSRRVHDTVEELAAQVVAALARRAGDGGGECPGLLTTGVPGERAGPARR